MNNININILDLIESIDGGVLTPNELIYLFYLLHDKPYEYKKDVDLDKLEKLKFIKLVKDSIVVREYKVLEYLRSLTATTEVIITEDKKEITKIIKDDGILNSFEKLIKAYPSKEDGRALINKTTAFPKFKIAFNDDGIDKILKGLNNQLEARKTALNRNKFFDGMQNLATWLHQKTYLVWLDVEPEIIIENTRRV